MVLEALEVVLVVQEDQGDLEDLEVPELDLEVPEGQGDLEDQEVLEVQEDPQMTWIALAQFLCQTCQHSHHQLLL